MKPILLSLLSSDVYPSGTLTGPIWTQTLKHGLNRPNLPLFKQLKHDVETAYPH
jgi:hypothetical protein